MPNYEDIYMLTVDPVGVVENKSIINSMADNIKKKWDNFKSSLEKTTKITLISITKFLLHSLDELILLANTFNKTGADKKALVLSVLSIVYDYVVKEAFPMWLLPFSGGIKGFVISTLMSIAIDWIVQKYVDGSWSK